MAEGNREVNGLETVLKRELDSIVEMVRKSDIDFDVNSRREAITSEKTRLTRRMGDVLKELGVDPNGLTFYQIREQLQSFYVSRIIDGTSLAGPTEQLLKEANNVAEDEKAFIDANEKREADLKDTIQRRLINDVNFSKEMANANMEDIDREIKSLEDDERNGNLLEELSRLYEEQKDRVSTIDRFLNEYQAIISLEGIREKIEQDRKLQDAELIVARQQEIQSEQEQMWNENYWTKDEIEADLDKMLREKNNEDEETLALDKDAAEQAYNYIGTVDSLRDLFTEFNNPYQTGIRGYLIRDSFNLLMGAEFGNISETDKATLNEIVLHSVENNAITEEQQKQLAKKLANKNLLNEETISDLKARGVLEDKDFIQDNTTGQIDPQGAVPPQGEQPNPKQNEDEQPPDPPTKPAFNLTSEILTLGGFALLFNREPRSDVFFANLQESARKVFSNINASDITQEDYNELADIALILDNNNGSYDQSIAGDFNNLKAELKKIINQYENDHPEAIKHREDQSLNDKKQAVDEAIASMRESFGEEDIEFGGNPANFIRAVNNYCDSIANDPKGSEDTLKQIQDFLNTPEMQKYSSVFGKTKTKVDDLLNSIEQAKNQPDPPEPPLPPEPPTNTMEQEEILLNSVQVAISGYDSTKPETANAVISAVDALHGYLNGNADQIKNYKDELIKLQESLGELDPYVVKGIFVTDFTSQVDLIKGLLNSIEQTKNQPEPPEKPPEVLFSTALGKFLAETVRNQPWDDLYWDDLKETADNIISNCVPKKISSFQYRDLASMKTHLNETDINKIPDLLKGEFRRIKDGINDLFEICKEAHPEFEKKQQPPASGKQGQGGEGTGNGNGDGRSQPVKAQIPETIDENFPINEALIEFAKKLSAFYKDFSEEDKNAVVSICSKIQSYVESYDHLIKDKKTIGELNKMVKYLSRLVAFKDIAYNLADLLDEKNLSFLDKVEYTLGGKYAFFYNGLGSTKHDKMNLIDRFLTKFKFYIHPSKFSLKAIWRADPNILAEIMYSEHNIDRYLSFLDGNPDGECFAIEYNDQNKKYRNRLLAAQEEYKALKEGTPTPKQVQQQQTEREEPESNNGAESTQGTKTFSDRIRDMYPTATMPGTYKGAMPILPKGVEIEKEGEGPEGEEPGQ